MLTKFISRAATRTAPLPLSTHGRWAEIIIITQDAWRLLL